MRHSTSGAPDPRTWVLPFQPRNFLRPCLLLLLDERPDYGYELRERAGHLSGAQWDAGTVYRVLNAMENEGLACSTWEPSPNGPQRRRYEITGEGQSVLSLWYEEVEEMRDVLLGFIERFDRVQQARLLGIRGLAAAEPEEPPDPRASEPRASILR